MSSEYRYEILEGTAESLYAMVPNRVKVEDAATVHTFGGLYHVEPYENLDVAKEQAAKKFFQALDGNIAATLLEAFDDKEVLPDAPNTIVLGLPMNYTALEVVKEGALPKGESLTVARFEPYSPMRVDLSRVTMKELTPPMILPLAKINAQDRFLIVAYFSIEVN